jgi:hypothetical protein
MTNSLSIHGQCDALTDGFHELTMAEYLALPLVGSSLAKKVKSRTPAYIRWALDGGTEPDETSAKTLGSVTHTAIFEPDFLKQLYRPLPVPDPNKHTTAEDKPSTNPAATSKYKAEVAALQAEYPAATLIPGTEYEKAMAMRDAVHGHSRAAALIHMVGPVEISGVATDSETGVRIKFRPDKLVDPLGANLQAKTTRNARWDVFSHDIYKFKYHVSEAFYARALKSVGWNFRHPFMLCIETEGPLSSDSVVVYELDEGLMDAGDRLCSRYLRQIAWCFEHDTWPGHAADHIPSISLPEYAWAKVDEEEHEIPALLPPDSVAIREEHSHV